MGGHLQVHVPGVDCVRAGGEQDKQGGEGGVGQGHIQLPRGKGGKGKVMVDVDGKEEEEGEEEHYKLKFPLVNWSPAPIELPPFSPPSPRQIY